MITLTQRIACYKGDFLKGKLELPLLADAFALINRHNEEITSYVVASPNLWKNLSVVMEDVVDHWEPHGYAELRRIQNLWQGFLYNGEVITLWGAIVCQCSFVPDNKIFVLGDKAIQGIEITE